ncbi:hypothetical protein H0W91_03255 [Patescibacteria group bacterium]|nr:hypothetical protein [Patescibacteria group bacterium]
MFWKNTQKIEPKLFIHFCLTCKEEFKLDQKLDRCPKCNEPIEEPDEHINRIIGLGWRYYHRCNTCKIRFDTRIDDKKAPYPRCRKPSEDYGYTIACGPGSGWRGFLIRYILP